ncbi:pseudaminic acid cytidylyltransferase [bacterium]|jgi:pseudaminic acid cytidylyltransferase|nr:pseudaminic acid cytidylyltransferase [bacterium]
MRKKVVAIIPARGGSKRIPYKNIRNFHGKPIIAWSIIAAKKSGIFDDIIVSTDSQRIADVANKYGAITPFIRPDSISDDFTGTNDVIKHAAKWYIENVGDIDYICGIYPTAPFLTSSVLVDGFHRLVNSNAAFVFSAVGYSYPIQRAFLISKNDRVQMLNKENISKRSQDLEKSYHDAGQFYWGLTSSFINNLNLYSDESIPMILPAHLAHDIDDEEDWKYAEMLYAGYKQNVKINNA